LGRIRADAVAQLARETMGADCEALFIACAQLPTFEILDDLGRELGRPVLSSIWATQQALRDRMLQAA
jgi:maleate cis-trans isomerase